MLGNSTAANNLSVTAAGNVEPGSQFLAHGGGQPVRHGHERLGYADPGRQLSHRRLALANTGTGNVTVNYNGALVLGTLNVGSGILSVTTAGAITQATNTTVTAAGNASFNATNGAITLTDANAFNGTLPLLNSGSNDVALTNAKALTLGVSTVGGNLTVTTAGNLTQAANTVINVSAASTFNATNGAITLGGVNAFNGAVTLTSTGANSVTVRNGQDLTLGNFSVGNGALSLTVAGNITQAANATITAAGTSAFSATNGATRRAAVHGRDRIAGIIHLHRVASMMHLAHR